MASYVSLTSDEVNESGLCKNVIMGYHESKMINFQTPQSWIFEKKIVDDAPPAGQPKGRAGKSGKFVDQNGQRLHISAGATAMAHFSYSFSSSWLTNFSY